MTWLTLEEMWFWVGMKRVKHGSRLESSQEVFGAFEFFQMLWSCPKITAYCPKMTREIWILQVFYLTCYRKKRVKSSTDGCFQAFLTPKTEIWASSIFSWHVFEVTGVHLCWIQWSVGTQQPVEGLTADDKTSLLSSRFSGIQPKEPGLSGNEKNLNNLEKSFNKRRDREPNGRWPRREGKVPQGRPSPKPTNPDKVPPPATKAAKGNKILWSDKTKMEPLMLEHPPTVWGHTAVAPIE